MDGRLHKAAIRGNVNSLRDLLEQDEHVLGVMDHPIATENPLHVAVQFGHVDFANEILSQKPEYAHKLNSQGQSPLHLASGAGHVEVVKLLLEKDASVCFLRDKRGMTPLHIAAKKGRLEVLKELVRAEPIAAWVQTEQGEPILHLCASDGQFDALKMLIDLIPDDDFVKMKDDNNNSILHLLAPEIETEVIEFLLRKRSPEINCLNMKKHTPLDALVKAPRRSGYRKCKRILCEAGGKRAKELSQELETTRPKNTWEAHANWLNETKSTLMVVAVLIASVTFQATLNPPGGVWQDHYPPLISPGEDLTKIRQWKLDNEDYIYHNEHFPGQAVMSDEAPIQYLFFSFSNLIGFLASASIILSLISGFNLKRRGLMWALMFAMWLSISSMVVTFAISLFTLTGEYAITYKRRTYLYILLLVISVLLVVIGPLVTAHLVRFVIGRHKKSRNPKPQGRAGSENKDGGAAIQMISVDPSTPSP